MRIIGGQWRGRRLFAPEGMETRPTSDKVREALFNIIRSDVYDAQVFDVFAGSGALSLEALSRGAEFAVLTEASRKAALGDYFKWCLNEGAASAARLNYVPLPENVVKLVEEKVLN